VVIINIVIDMDKRSYIASVLSNQIDNIKKLSIYELKLYINDIIRQYNIDHTSNRNGIFINVSLIDDRVIDLIYNKLVSLTSSIVHVDNTDESSIMDSIHPIPDIVNQPTSKDKIKYKSVDTYLLTLSKLNLSI
jgi:hypothetical protein